MTAQSNMHPNPEEEKFILVDDSKVKEIDKDKFIEYLDRATLIIYRESRKYYQFD